MASPISTQVPIRPTDGSAQPKSPSQPRVRPPSPKNRSVPLTGPWSE